MPTLFHDEDARSNNPQIYVILLSVKIKNLNASWFIRKTKLYFK